MRKKLVWLYLSCFVGFFFSAMYPFARSNLYGLDEPMAVLVVFALYVYALSPWALKTHRAIRYAWRRVLIVAASFGCLSFYFEGLDSPGDLDDFIDMIFLCVTLFSLVFVVKIPDDSDNGDESV